MNKYWGLCGIDLMLRNQDQWLFAFSFLMFLIIDVILGDVTPSNFIPQQTMFHVWRFGFGRLWWYLICLLSRITQRGVHRSIRLHWLILWQHSWLGIYHWLGLTFFVIISRPSQQPSQFLSSFRSGGFLFQSSLGLLWK